MSISILEYLRSFRIGGFAVFDFVMALLGMYLVAPYLGISRNTALLLSVPLGIVAHEIVGIRTPFNKFVIESNDCVSKIVVTLLVVFGGMSLYKDITNVEI